MSKLYCQFASFSRFMLMLGLCFVFPKNYSIAQQAKVLSLDDAVNMALSNHPAAKNAELKLESAKYRKEGSLNLEPAKISWQHGQGQSPIKDNYFSISQNLGSPLTHYQRNKYLKNQLELTGTSGKLSKKQLIASVKEAYFQWIYQYALINLLEQETQFYEALLEDTTMVADSSSTGLLEKLRAGNHYAETYKNLLTVQEQLKIETNRLNRVIYSEGPYEPVNKELNIYSIAFPENVEDKFYPYTFRDYFQKQIHQTNISIEIEKSHFFPEIHAGYFRQKLTPLFDVQGFELGLSVPLWFWAPAAKVREAKLNREIAVNEATMQTYELEQTIDDLKIKLDQQFITIIYSRENGLNQADLMLNLASTGLQKKQISITTYFQSVADAMRIKQDYLKSILNYNMSAVELEYYLN
jgi:heavy metal efflux system protein